ncbi:MAG: RecX family transcriptional regulator [Bacteroidales bacterium]|nr:RecX family transcriptional regulator [Bacteroidales bacterium]
MTLYAKLTKYAAYQDRCSWDVEKKMKEWKVSVGTQKKLLEQLKSDGFLDDRRFAASFVRGKFRVNKWGRIRISFELRGRKLSTAIISEALLEIDEEEYLETIRTLIARKSGEINPEKTLNKREKIINFVVGKGFETDLVLRMIREIKI